MKARCMIVSSGGEQTLIPVGVGAIIRKENEIAFSSGKIYTGFMLKSAGDAEEVMEKILFFTVTPEQGDILYIDATGTNVKTSIKKLLTKEKKK